MTTIHLIPQAHLDPIWLWPWTAGLDEAIATCRTACDLLDRHPDFTFNMGDAWVLEQVEQTDPGTFARIQSAVKAGRWDLSGGWFIQPDCNFPLDVSILKQIEIGLAFLRDRFDGMSPTIAMNVDSFGHASSFPTLLRRAGQAHYVMMRPQEHEMPLTARLFNWRDPATGEQVTTFRIAGAYCTPGRLELNHVQKSLTELPPGVEHTMCFIGVSDHGGGPTEQMIDWCRTHRNAIDGAEMVFSTPARFFESIAPVLARLPVVEGELQYHAIGCYGIAARLKRDVRRAEHRLMQAERCARLDPASPPSTENGRLDAWRSICFHEFHDTIGGTCLPSAYQYVSDDVGGAAAEAERQSAYALRRMMLTRLGDDPLQRIVLFNPSTEPFDGYLEFEPWCEFTPWQANWDLLDPTGASVPFQRMDGEAVSHPIDRIVFRVSLAPDELRAVRIDRGHQGPPNITRRVSTTHDGVANDDGVAIRHDGQTIRHLAFASTEPSLPSPILTLIDDPSDTWSHRIDRYPAGPATRPHWKAFGVVDNGPLMASILQEGQIGDSDVFAEWRVYADMPFIDLRLRIDWRERQKVLKLHWATVAPVRSRVDGTLGGHTQRPVDGREYPIQDWVLLRDDRGVDLGIVCPDSFATDVSEGGVRLTLLRSPILAHHDPNLGTSPRRQFADRGEHVLRFRFFSGRTLDPVGMRRSAMAFHQPPLIADLTRGMPSRFLRGQTG